MNIALQIATERLAKARIVLAAHEAEVQMLRESGETMKVRAAQARVNGLRTAVGKAAFAVRQAGGIA
jgi:hypothetical protein